MATEAVFGSTSLLVLPEKSAGLFKLAQVPERAETIFEGAALAWDWLMTSNPCLGGKTPLTLLDTGNGMGSVMDTLGRIEQGVFV